MIGIIMDFNVVLWGNRLRAVSARPYKALAKSLLPYPTIIPAEPKKSPRPTWRGTGERDQMEKGGFVGALCRGGH